MGDGLGVQLEHHREADFRGGAGGFILAHGDARLDGRDAVARQELLGFVLGQDRASRLARSLDDRGGRLAVDRFAVVAVQGGRLVEGAQVVGVLRHVVEHAGGGVGIGEGGDVRLVQNGFSLLNIRAAHPARQDRLAEGLGVRLQLLGGLGRVGHGLRGEDHQHTVALGSLAAISRALA